MVIDHVQTGNALAEDPTPPGFTRSARTPAWLHLKLWSWRKMTSLADNRNGGRLRLNTTRSTTTTTRRSNARMGSGGVLVLNKRRNRRCGQRNSGKKKRAKSVQPTYRPLHCETKRNRDLVTYHLTSRYSTMNHGPSSARGKNWGLQHGMFAPCVNSERYKQWGRNYKDCTLRSVDSQKLGGKVHGIPVH